jgi:hypothetical protein
MEKELKPTLMSSLSTFPEVLVDMVVSYLTKGKRKPIPHFYPSL